MVIKPVQHGSEKYSSYSSLVLILDLRLTVLIFTAVGSLAPESEGSYVADVMN